MITDDKCQNRPIFMKIDLYLTLSTKFWLINQFYQLFNQFNLLNNPKLFDNCGILVNLIKKLHSNQNQTKRLIVRIWTMMSESRFELDHLIPFMTPNRQTFTRPPSCMTSFSINCCNFFTNQSVNSSMPNMLWFKIFY